MRAEHIFETFPHPQLELAQSFGAQTRAKHSFLRHLQMQRGGGYSLNSGTECTHGLRQGLVVSGTFGWRKLSEHTHVLCLLRTQSSGHINLLFISSHFPEDRLGPCRCERHRAPKHLIQV